MKIFSRDNPSRPLIMVCTTYAIVCYALFFIAWLLPTPEWAPTLMAWFAKTIKAIAVSTRVGELNGYDPFPIQVVILYCVFGTLPIALYVIKFAYFNPRNRSKWFESIIAQMENKKLPRLKLFFLGIVGIAICTFFPYIIFFVGRRSIDWSTLRNYSPTLLATSLFLMGSLLLTFASVGIAHIYIAFSKQFKNHKERH